MRLTIQSFQKYFDPNDTDNQNKLNDFTNLLIQQIDTMTDVAEAFSNFVVFQKQKMKKYDLVKLQKQQLIFLIKKKLFFHLTKLMSFTYWIKHNGFSITKLVQNALQSVPKTRNPQIGIQLNTEPLKLFFL